MTLRNRLPSFVNSRTLTALAVVLLVAGTIPFAVFAVPQTVGADTSYVVISSSMSPAIHANDAIIVRDVPAEEIREGDIIAFTDPGDSEGDGPSVISHRVVKVELTSEGRMFTTKGDALEEVDPERIPASAVVGRVAFTIPYIGHVIQFAGSDTGFLALVVVPFGLLILNELWNLFVLFAGSEEPSEGEEEVVAEPTPED